MLARQAAATARLALAALLALALPAGPASAEVYKWTDEDGSVVFSEKPPPGKKAESINPRYAKQSAAKKSTRGSPGDSEAESAKKQEEPKLSPEQIAQKEKNCENAKQQIADMNSPRATRLQYTNEAGELAYITPEQRSARIRDANDAKKKFCE